MDEQMEEGQGQSTVSRIARHWSSTFMMMVTMAVMATTTVASTVGDNAVALGLVAGVITTGLQQPVADGLWDAKQMLQEDLMPNFNYEDVFFGPTRAQHYSYEVGHVTEDTTSIIEKQYKFNPHDAAADNRLSPIAEQVFVIPRMPSHSANVTESADANQRHQATISSVRAWRQAKKRCQSRT